MWQFHKVRNYRVMDLPRTVARLIVYVWERERKKTYNHFQETHNCWNYFSASKRLLPPSVLAAIPREIIYKKRNFAHSSRLVKDFGNRKATIKQTLVSNNFLNIKKEQNEFKSIHNLIQIIYPFLWLWLYSCGSVI